MTMKRRDALKSFGALAGAGGMHHLLTACGGGGGGGGADGGGGFDGGPGFDARPPGIDTMVFLMMENRSYDHVFGARAFDRLPGNGLVAGMANPDSRGNSIGIWPGTPDSACVVLDPPHGWDQAHVQWNKGANDGFVLAHQQRHGSTTAIDPMQYMTREQMPVSWALADAYTSCDQWFSAILGPTWPNRMYWHSASSGGLTENVVPEAFDWQTIYHPLNAAGIPWTYYYGDLPALAVLSDDVIDGHIKRFMYDFIDDAAAGVLPPVVYIDPGFSINDDHPPHHPLLGQQFIASVYQALATSPQWERCLLVITYDENGGFYDHVAPGTTTDEREASGFGQLGFRVPGLVIGPYTKNGHVSSEIYEHTSPLKHIAGVFGFEPLNARTAAASDLTDCIDLARLEAGMPSAPIKLPAVEIDESMIGPECSGTGKRMHHDVLEWGDSANLPAGMDRRKFAKDYVHDIGAYLDRHDLGRIRKGR